MQTESDGAAGNSHSHTHTHTHSLMLEKNSKLDTLTEERMIHMHNIWPQKSSKHHSELDWSEFFPSTLSDFNKHLTPVLSTMSHDHLFLVMCVSMSNRGVVGSEHISRCKVVFWGRSAPTREDVRHPRLGLPATAPLKPERKEKLSHSAHCTTDHTTLWAVHSDTPPTGVVSLHVAGRCGMKVEHCR